MPQLPFTIHPRVISLLSKQLVQTQERAVLELVKNAYDADATECHIEIFPRPGEIVIRDNGHGMTPTDIKSGWLILGSPLKLTRGRSKEKKRWVAGSKGLGRMALSKLGSRAEVLTGTGRTAWRTFTFDPEAIAQVAASGRKPKVDLQNAKKPEAALGNRGTVIIISGVDPSFGSPGEIEELKRSLRLLKSPEFERVHPGDTFDIWLSLNGGESERLDSPEFDGFHHIRASGEVLDDRQCQLEIAPNRARYAGKGTATPRTITIEGDFSELSGVTFRWAWTLRGAAPGDEQYWRLPSSKDERGLVGVFIYRDGIRVQPYGDEDQDWLKLQSTYVKRGPMQRHPRPNQVLGWMSISREFNVGFEENPSREGLDHNAAFKQLRALGEAIADEIAELRRELEPPREGNVDPQQSGQGRDE